MKTKLVDSAQEVIQRTEEGVRAIIQEAVDKGVESALVESSVKDICSFCDEARMKIAEDCQYNPYTIAKRTVKLWKKHISENAKFITEEIGKMEV